jgi:hypothetical protein
VPRDPKTNLFHLGIEREEWKYGKGLKLAWGDERVRPGNDKWVFVFETT